jgi:hypothetical protein
MKNLKHFISACAALSILSLTIFAQTIIWRAGDTVQMPDGRTGKIESFKPFSDLIKVQFPDGSTQYFALTDLKKAVDLSKPTFRVGDTAISPRSPKGTSGVIESVNGNSARVRFGRGKYDYVDDLLENLMTPQQVAVEQENARQEQTQKPLRAQFMDEAEAFSTTVYKLAPVFDPKYQHIGTGITQENKTYEAWRKDLESLDAVCRKYPNMTNPSMDSIYQHNVKYFPADWCKIAAQRTEMLQKMKRTVGDTFAKSEIHSWTLKVNEAFEHPDGYVTDEIQMLLYDRTAWNRKHLPAMEQNCLGAGGVAQELFKPLDDKITELKAKIESDAATRTWEDKTSFKDAALEAVGRRDILTDLPGARILKTGMADTTWAVMDGRTEVGSVRGGGSIYRFYRINKGAYRYKVGRALVQLPNRPFCQIRAFQVTQYKAGAGYGAAQASSSDAGRFVKCQ